MKLKNINKTYDERMIIKNLDISFKKNQITFITGVSGSGKTTLLYLLGLIEKPSSGEIMFGQEVYPSIDSIKGSDFRSKHINFIFQDNNLFTGLSVYENLSLITNLSGKIIEEVRINDLLDEFALFQVKDQKIETLSGGERQRLTVMAALLRNNDIILADEPTGSLDSFNSEKVYEKLVRIKKDKYVIIVSHNIEYARKYGDRIIVFRDGEVISDFENSTSYSSDFTHEANAEKKKRQGLSIADIYNFFKRNFYRRKTAFLASVLMIAFSMIAISLMLSLSNTVENILNDVNVNYLETDLITVNRSKSFAYGDFMPLLVQDVEIFEADTDFKQTTLKYYNNLFLEIENKFEQANIRQVEINSFYQERFSNNIKDKQFITDSGQIILAADVCHDFFEGDCIDQSIYLSNGSGQRIVLKVKGINLQANPLGEIESYVLNSDVEVLMNQYYAHISYLEFFQSDKFLSNVVYGGVGTEFGFINNDIDLLYGDGPANVNEIVISSASLLYFLHELGIDSTGIIQTTIDEGNLDQNILDALFTEKLIVAINDLIEIEVSGVYLSSLIEIKFLSEAEIQFFTAKPIQIELFASDIDEISLIKEKLNNYTQFEVLFNYEYLQSGINGKTRVIQYIVTIFSVLMGLAGLLMINNYAKNKVEIERYDIGLLKIYGARKKDIFNLFLFDSLVICSISFTLAVLISEILIWLMPNLLSIFNDIKLEANVLTYITIFVVSIPIVILSELRSLIKAVKMSIGEAIRTRN
jgi:ABC-type lipoprotein export system ATPase subunit/cell division protein FtsX